MKRIMLIAFTAMLAAAEYGTYFTPEENALIQAAFRSARDSNAPEAYLSAKVNEGIAKRSPSARIVTAVTNCAAKLVSAARIADIANIPKAERERALTLFTDAMINGLTAEDIEHIRASSGNDVIADLIRAYLTLSSYQSDAALSRTLVRTLAEKRITRTELADIMNVIARYDRDQLRMSRREILESVADGIRDGKRGHALTRAVERNAESRTPLRRIKRRQ
ncbi:MAG: hypothetical protein AABZ39_05940 [Spirochaetota bacterium]